MVEFPRLSSLAVITRGFQSNQLAISEMLFASTFSNYIITRMINHETGAISAAILAGVFICIRLCSMPSYTGRGTTVEWIIILWNNVTRKSRNIIGNTQLKQTYNKTIITKEEWTSCVGKDNCLGKSTPCPQGCCSGEARRWPPESPLGAMRSS